MNKRSLAGVVFLGGLAAVIGASIWLDQSDFRPVVTKSSVSYLLRSASLRSLATDIGGVAVALFVVDAARRRWLVSAPRPWTLPLYGDVRCFRPLAFVGLNLAALGVLVPSSLRAWWAPVAYIAVDLHSIVIIAATALFLMELQAVSRPELRARWRRAIASQLDRLASLSVNEMGVAAAVVAAVVVTSPIVRFSSIVVGDEPKYLRYCENWWQGHGIEVGHIRDISELRRTASSHYLKNLAMLGSTLREDLASLADDVKLVSQPRHWSHRFNKSVYEGSWIIRGKSNDLYQMHNPGIAAIILPAYALDRWLFDRKTSRFPDDLFTVNLAFLVMFAWVAVAIWRLTLANGASPLVSLVVTFSVSLSLPLGAFAFQFYPEMMGALIVTLLCWHLVSAAPLVLRTALLVGFGLGLLGWLHVRFLPMAAVGFGWVVWTHWHERAPLAVVALTFAVLTSGLCLYAYHITGSIVPSAMYSPEGGHDQFSWSAVPDGLLRQIFDRDYGILPLAPAFLLALPGFGLMLRRHRRTLLLVVSIGSALFIPASGHGVEIAGTTPGRFVLAVMPLAALPISEWLRVVRRRPSLMAVSVLLLVVSVRNCAAHNFQNAKISVTMMDEGFSGWNPSMLFPLIPRHVSWIPRAFDPSALIIWIGVAVLAIAASAAMVGRRRADARPLPIPDVAGAERLTALSLLGLAGLGFLAIAGGGERREPQFLPTPGASLTQEAGANSAGWLRVAVEPVPLPPPTPAAAER